MTFPPHEKERFVQRSLVETRQIMKNVATIMRKRYGNSAAVIGLNSELTKEMRQYLGFSHRTVISTTITMLRTRCASVLRVSSRLIEASSLMAWFPMEQ